MSEPYIQISGLRKTYSMGSVNVHALAGLDLEIPENTFCLVMGPSGSGKSTLLYLLGGLDRPSEGKIRVAGRQIELLDENALAVYRRRTVGFVFQAFNLISSMTALENVAFPMRFANVTGRQRQATAMDMLARVGLEDRAYHKPSELSGGQQQRVAIARALVNQPYIIMADEPTGNLDTASGDDVMNLLSDLHREGTTVVVVSHDARMRKFAGQVVTILDGRINSNQIH